jgi:hypothetical protein
MKQTLKVLLILSALFIVVHSCKKENDDSYTPPPPPGNNTGTMTATISGRATDESNNAVINASVSINGHLTTTDQHGIFLLKNISVNSRSIATITKNGFFNCNHAFKVAANEVNYIRVVMMSNAQTHTLSASSGGTVSLTDGSSIQFAPNSFVNATTGSAYTGTVILSVKHLSPDAANFGFMIPGGDLLGKDAGGSDVALYTYGMLGAELKGSSGEQLQLAAGSTATLTMRIAASQTGTAPSSIPLWYFDEATSLWKEEGSATKVGSNYVGTVSHFSWWNCDIPFDKATISGKVLDCNNVPMPNVVVTVNGSATLITNSQGLYSNWVPAGLPLTVQVLASNNFYLFPNSQLENVPALSVNQTFYVPDLIVACPAHIQGNLQNCSGQSIDGLVVFNWAGGPTFEYTTSGQFNLISAASTLINLDASAYYDSTLYSYSGSFTSGAANTTINVGNVLLCDSNSDSNSNDFFINGGPFVNEYFVLPTAIATTSGTSTTLYYTSGSNSTYNISYNRVMMDRITPGNSYWDFTSNIPSITIDLSNGTDVFSIRTNVWSSSSTSSGTIDLNYIGTIGDHVVGDFYGTAVCSQDSFVTSFPVNIIGHFDGIRQ